MTLTDTSIANMPTDFYSLSLELRQKILLNSFDEPLANDVAFNTNLSRIDQALNGIGTDAKSFDFAPYISAWAHILKSTHSMVSQDLGFVIRTTIQALKAKSLCTLPHLSLPRSRPTNKSERWFSMLTVRGRSSFFLYRGEVLMDSLGRLR